MLAQFRTFKTIVFTIFKRDNCGLPTIIILLHARIILQYKIVDYFQFITKIRILILLIESEITELY